MEKSVLFICADQWRWDCFGFMGHKCAHTPNIDKLASRSTAFRKHFTAIVPCGPALTSMLTGLYPFIHRSVYNGAPLDKRFTSIPLEARKLGYKPALYGYTDTSYDPRGLEKNDPRLFTYESPMYGFDQVCHLPEGNPELWADHLKQHGYKIKKSNELYNSRQAKKGEGFIYKAWEIPTEHSDTSFLADRAVADLQNATEPFFMHISFLKPHPPFVVSEPWHSLIDPGSLEPPITHGTKQEMINHHPILKNMMARYDDENSYPSEINFPELTGQDISRIQAVYLGMCAEVDSNIGKILKALDDSGQMDNTMIIFTSDHGEMLGDYWQWGKNGWWDQSYRIPLIVHTPNCKTQLIDQMTESVDLAPTIINWLGGDIPADWNGRSLLSIVENTQFQLPPREFVVFEWDFREPYYTDFIEKLKLAPEECNLTVIRSNEWKYVHFPTFPSLLYNLNNDPYEKDNLASNPTYDSIKAEMAGKLLSHRMLHAERQMSNTKLTSTGPQTLHGPPHRRILES